MKRYGIVVFVIVVAVFGMQSWGYATTFNVRSSFMKAVGSAESESFETLTATNTTTLTTLSVADFVITTDNPVFGVFDQPSSGGHATDGSQHVLFWDVVPNPYIVTIEFSSPIVAFGVDITDWELGSDNPIVFSYEGGAFDAAISSRDGGEEFFGIIDSGNPFTRVEFIMPSVRDGWTIDLVTYSDVLSPEPIIPIPAAVWLFSSGLIGLIGIARRKKS